MLLMIDRSLYNECVKVFNPVTRKANRRYKWHKIVEDLKNAEYARIPEFTPEEDDVDQRIAI